MADKTSILEGKILRVSRIVTGVAVWAVATWTLVSYGMTYPEMAIWIEKIQFFQAAMVFSISTVVIWLIVTLVFGRIYCSVACPLGVFQDICARIPRLGRYPSRRHYHYSQPLTLWRNISLACVVVSIFLGIAIATTFLDPWSIYSRTCNDIIKPLWGYVLNMFSDPAVKIASASAIGSSVSAVSIILIGWIASRNGRTFCNSICPVGTTLGYVSRYAIYHIDINTDKCTQCRKCEHVCKASCIDLTSHVVDSSRCVDCFDCLPVCEDDAIHYTWSRHSLSTPLMMKVENPFRPNNRRYKLGGYTGCNQCADSTEKDLSENRKPKQ